MSKKPTKSETLTIRLDPKTRFMLEFMARLRGQTITTVVERAIVEAANQSTLEGNYGTQTWRNFWSMVEGERALNIAGAAALFPTYDEERRLAFAKEHWPFFYARGADNFMSHYVDILWPRIDDFIYVHDTQKSGDYFAAGKAMQQALRDAKLKPPDWPIAEKEPKTKRPGGGSMDDDEIPF